MRLTAAAAADPLSEAVARALEVRLDRGSRAPVALGLSGGGDSLALLHLAARWCAGAGRPLLALTVDHGLHPDSGAWTCAAGEMARAAGASWRPLSWEGPKPATGVPAAARAARHALLADAAREAGACVLLLAHTADDLTEADVMQFQGTRGVSVPRVWAPSPAWPQGRGLFLLRPLLRARRAELREQLAAGGHAWLEDPANSDPRYARARARLFCVARRMGLDPVSPSVDLKPGFGEATADGRVMFSREQLKSAFSFHEFRSALACAAGGLRRTRTPVLQRLFDRLHEGEDFTAGAGGARVEAAAGWVEVGREAGRAIERDAALRKGAAVLWDGRFEARASEPGWSIGPAGGRLSRLPKPDRAALAGLPPAARRSHPVFLRGEEVRLEGEGLELRGWVGARFDAAIGRVRTEVELRASIPAFRTSPSCGTTTAAGAS